MKVEDIQIGDWVQNPLGAPYQVLAIHFYKINGDGDGYYGIHLKNKGAEARLEIYDLHPVPLTPEILEKNGFSGEGYNMGIVGFNVEPISDKEDGYEVFIWKDMCLQIEHGFTHFKKYIKYVHELQHALRLCGISLDLKI